MLPFFGSANIAYGIFFYLASKGNLTSLSALTFLTPIFALLFGTILLSETLSSIQSLGVFLTVISIYLINQRDNIAKKLSSTPIESTVDILNLTSSEELTKKG